MRYLVTGVSGFVGEYFANYVLNRGDDNELIGIYRFNKPHLSNERLRLIQLDLNYSDHLQKLLIEFRPNYIVHLASESSVGFSWKEPSKSFLNNVNIYLKLLESIRISGVNCRLLSIGSSETYGNVKNVKVPLTESTIVNPISPYAVARYSQELLSKVYVESFGLDIVSTRSFNHIGPGQDERFVVSSFVKKILSIRNNRTESVVRTGDLSIIRDFTDVRDVVRAYELLLSKGQNGEIYNVCSGTGIKLYELINKICAEIDVQINTQIDDSLLRPNDIKKVVGNNAKIKEAILWTPKYSLNDTLVDMINYEDGRE